MKDLMEAIRYNNNGIFPRAALRQIIDRKEEAIPYLIEILEAVRDDHKSFLKESKRIDHIYALYLLCQFRHNDLFPLLVDLFSKPGETPFDLFGDVITDDAGRMLATVFSGEDILPITNMIEDSKINEFVRGQALYSLVTLVVDGRISRELVIDYYKQLMNGRLRDTNYFVYSKIICCCNDLYPEEVYQDIERLFEQDLIEPFFIRMENVDDNLKRAKEDVLKETQQHWRYQLINDTIAEMQRWGCFNQQRNNKHRVSYTNAEQLTLFSEPLNNPAVRVEKIGRNAPCSCGSGKKYKKCCGK